MAEPIFCTTATVNYYAGAGCSATSKAEAYVLVYGAGWEGYINVTSQYNWTDWYTTGTPNADVKSLLSGIQARLIAIDVINYDFSGFPSRIDAEDRINVLYQTAMDMMETLKQHAAGKFMQTT